MTKNKRRKICVLVLNRSEYSRLKRLIVALSSDERFQLSTVALQSSFSDNEILFRHDNLPLTEVVRMGIFERHLKDMSKAIGSLVEKFGEVFHKLEPEIVVIHGDRYEAMAAALAATFNNIFIVHLQGGEITGTVDEHLRHAITKLAHFHLPSTELAAERIKKMGEAPESVVYVGCPGIDLMLETPKLSFSELRYELYKSSNNRKDVLEKFREDYFLVMQSPVTTEVKEATYQIKETLNTLSEFNHLKIILLPNPDAGGDIMQEEIMNFSKGREDFLVFKHFPPEVFTNLLRMSKIMIGNSSAGIRETGYFGVPTVNIGSRQHGRERSSNIIDVGNNKEEIKKAIEKQLEHGLYEKEKIYGGGGAALKIVDLLANVDINKIQKRLSY